MFSNQTKFYTDALKQLNKLTFEMQLHQNPKMKKRLDNYHELMKELSAVTCLINNDKLEIRINTTGGSFGEKQSMASIILSTSDIKLY